MQARVLKRRERWGREKREEKVLEFVSCKGKKGLKRKKEKRKEKRKEKVISFRSVFFFGDHGFSFSISSAVSCWSLANAVGSGTLRK